MDPEKSMEALRQAIQRALESGDLLPDQQLQDLLDGTPEQQDAKMKEMIGQLMAVLMAEVLAGLQESGIEVSDIRQIFELASDWSRRLVSETESTVALSEVVERVELTVGGIRVGLKLVLPSGAGETPAEILRVSHFAPIK